MKKQSGWKTKGMNRDLSVSAFNPEFAFENMNLRLSTNEGNTLMSWVNEKGTKPLAMKYAKEGRGASIVPASVEGTCIGTAVINNYLVLFLTNRTGVNPDAICRLRCFGEGNYVEVVELFSGDLHFSVAHPIETLVSYEAMDIQKVYWVDGINQPRLINIAPIVKENGETVEREHKSAASFDFVPTLELKETVKVKKVTGGGGMFAPGVIQYAFTYYYKYGQESNIFWVTPLIYISHIDRGAAPDDKVDNIFKITVSGIDTNFDYLRIYSIQRTSINSTPICKRIQDIAIEGKVRTSRKISFIDTGTIGNSIDPMELQYKGGIPISAGTMEQKDNTLFLGNLTVEANDDLAGFTYIDNNEEKVLDDNIDLSVTTRKFYSLQTSTGDYEYANQLNSYDSISSDNSVPCAEFKYGNKYRCGVQFQDALGRWTAPILLEDLDIESGEVDVHPSIRQVSEGEDTPTPTPDDPDTPVNPDDPVTPGEEDDPVTPGGDENVYIDINLINDTGTPIYTSGKVKLWIWDTQGDWGEVFFIKNGMSEAYCKREYMIPANGSLTYSYRDCVIRCKYSSETVSKYFGGTFFYDPQSEGDVRPYVYTYTQMWDATTALDNNKKITTTNVEGNNGVFANGTDGAPTVYTVHVGLNPAYASEDFIVGP